ncbi:MAG: Stage sporulation protein [Planctomycetota bacterium]
MSSVPLICPQLCFFPLSVCVVGAQNFGYFRAIADNDVESEPAVEITEVRIKLASDPEDRLRAFCSITLDGEFVVRDLKIIAGQRGNFVAMPSRKIMEKCPRCHGKNEQKARFCSHCGTAQSAPPVSDQRPRLFADIAHPINSTCRERLEKAILAAFEEEQVRATQPGYVCRYDDYDEV